VIVDYVHLVRSVTRPENRAQEVSAIIRGLKELAKELGAALIAVSQLSRDVEYRENKRPQLSDLRDSGEIEQVADIIIFVYREEYYLAQAEPSRKADQNDTAYEAAHDKWSEKLARVRAVAQLVVAKNRQGEIGPVNVRFDAERTHFENLMEG
jgi:replicative DNA helicase